VSLTEELASFAVELDAGALDDETSRAVRRAVIDSLGVTVAGTRHPAARIVVDTLRALGRRGSATVVGSTRRVDVLGATLANGVMAHVLDWDDTLLPTRLHLSATLIPALLATGESHRWSGAQLSAAFAIGFEIQARLAKAVSPSMPDRGWHGTGVVGGVGVAAAVARLLGLDTTRTAHAIGIAASGGAGLVATFGSMSKSLNLGRAGAVGVESAYLAAGGFTSHPDIVGEGGFLRMYDDEPRPAALLDGLGSRWAVLENGYKPYPCGVVAHAAIDGVLQLRAQISPSDGLSALRLQVPPETARLMGNPEPRTGLEAKFSVRYAAAVAWVDAMVLPEAFEDQAVSGPAYRETMERIAVKVIPGLAQDEARIEAETTSGSSLAVHVEHARGTAGRPLTDDELQAKFLTACRIGGNGNGPQLLCTVDQLERIAVSEITALLPGDGGLDAATIDEEKAR